MDQKKLDVVIAFLEKKGFTARVYKKDRASFTTNAVYDGELVVLNDIRNVFNLKLDLKPTGGRIRVIFSA